MALGPKVQPPSIDRAIMLLRLLILFYLVGICAAVVASFLEIESILITGPCLSLFGLMITAVALAVGAYECTWLGMAVPTIAVICFSLIHGLSWGSDAAQALIPAFLFLCGAIILPAGSHALGAIRYRSVDRVTTTFQFRLYTLIVLTTVCALPLAFMQVGRGATAVGVLVSYSILLAMMARSLTSLRRTKAPVVVSQESKRAQR